LTRNNYNYAVNISVNFIHYTIVKTLLHKGHSKS